MKKLAKIMGALALLVSFAGAAKAANFAGITLDVTLDGNLTVNIIGSTNTAFGSVILGQSKVSAAGIVVENGSTGVSLTYELESFNSTPLVLAAAAGANQFALKGIFNTTGAAAPVLSDFGAQDAIFPDATFVKATTSGGAGKFEGDASGAGVAAGAQRKLWFRFDAPTTSTSVGARQVSVTVLGNP